MDLVSAHEHETSRVVTPPVVNLSPTWLPIAESKYGFRASLRPGPNSEFSRAMNSVSSALRCSAFKPPLGQDERCSVWRTLHSRGDHWWKTEPTGKHAFGLALKFSSETDDARTGDVVCLLPALHQPKTDARPTEIATNGERQKLDNEQRTQDQWWRLEKDDGRRRFLCSQPGIIPNVSDTHA